MAMINIVAGMWDDTKDLTETIKIDQKSKELIGLKREILKNEQIKEETSYDKYDLLRQLPVLKIL